MRSTRLGDLNVRIVSALPPGEDPDRIIVLCHGFGAPGDDLVPIGAQLARQVPEVVGRDLFVFPEAPHDLAAIGMPGARAWWELDTERLAAVAAGEPPGPRRSECPEGLTLARRSLEAVVEELELGTDLPREKIVVGGFSQGAMLTTDLALHSERAPAGLVVLSGTLLCEDGWRTLAPRRAGLPVFQSHGRSDPLLAFGEAEALARLLEAGGLEVQFEAFDGPHTITPGVLGRLVDWLASPRSG